MSRPVLGVLTLAVGLVEAVAQRAHLDRHALEERPHLGRVETPEGGREAAVGDLLG